MSSTQNINKINKPSIFGAIKLITICTISLSLLSTLTTSASENLKVNTKDNLVSETNGDTTINFDLKTKKMRPKKHKEQSYSK